MICIRYSAVHVGGGRGSWWCFVVSMTWVFRCQSPCQGRESYVSQCQYCTWVMIIHKCLCVPVCIPFSFKREKKDHENIQNFSCVGPFCIHLHPLILYFQMHNTETGVSGCCQEKTVRPLILYLIYVKASCVIEYILHAAKQC